MAYDVQAGVFPLKPGRTCPRCPAFFICGPLPDGPLKKKLRLTLPVALLVERLALQTRGEPPGHTERTTS